MYSYMEMPHGYSLHRDDPPRAKGASLDGISQWLLASLVISGIFLQKTPVPLGGETQYFLTFFIILAVTALGVMSGRLEIRTMATALYCLMAGGIMLTQVATAHEFSVASVILLLIMHIPYIFRLKANTTRPGMELRLFQDIMLFLAIAGIIQYASQFFIGWQNAFFFDARMPKQLVMAGYHQLNPMKYGSSVYKSNGVFLIEPSIFSQMLALSIIIEMVYFKRALRILFYLAGIVVSYSGTGIILLALLAPVYLLQKRKFALLAFLALLLAAAIGLAPFLGLNAFVARANEFSDPNSSGFARFISMFIVIRDFILPQGDTLFFGMGAGVLKDTLQHVDFASFDPTWGKIFFEYGLIGSLVYFPFMTWVIFSAPRSGYLKAALMIQFLFLGEFALTPITHIIIIALLAWPSEDMPAAAMSRHKEEAWRPEELMAA